MNAKIKGIIDDVAKQKEAEKQAKNAFQCPFCGTKLKNESLGKCALRAEKAGGTGEKLKAYFSAKKS